jgi:hypothetical protein
MRKEVFIALLIGLSLGLVVAFGIRTARESLARRPQSTDQSTSTTTLPNQLAQTILITTPEPDEIVSESELNVIGTTAAKSMISISSLTGEVAVMADDAGAFNAIIELESGINPIKITSFSPEGDESSVELFTILSTVDFATDSAMVSN